MSVTQVSYAGEQCERPISGYPSLSFGMTAIRGSFCKNQLDRARWLGFTSVSMNPSFFFNADGTVDPHENPQDLKACFDYAKKLGFDIIYKPMIEARDTSEASRQTQPVAKPLSLEERLMAVPTSTTSPWRAKFEFRPGDDYFQKAILPFVQWLENSNVAGTSLKASIVVATEMHRSVSEHGADWNRLMWNVQKRLEDSKLRSQVQVGIDPTIFGFAFWLDADLRRNLTKSECKDYMDMMWTADFFSSSIYGDYLAAGFENSPKDAVERVFESVESDWEKSVRSRGCKVNQGLANRYKTADFASRDQGRAGKIAWAGEMGYGGSLKHSYSNFETPPPYNQGREKMQEYANSTLKEEQQNFVNHAPIWVKGVLDDARGSNRDTVNFWITGRFDLFGFSSLPPLGDLNTVDAQFTQNDPVRGADAIPAVAQIRDLIQSYTRERCPGWEPALPAVPTPIKKRVVRRRTAHKIALKVNPIVHEDDHPILPSSLDQSWADGDEQYSP